MIFFKVILTAVFVFILREYLYYKFLKLQKKYYFTLAALIGFCPAALLPFFASIEEIDSYNSTGLVLVIALFVLYFPLTIKKIYINDEGKFTFM